MSKRRNSLRRQRRRELATRPMQHEQRQVDIETLPDRYRELAKHAAFVLRHDGIGEAQADSLATGFVLQLIGCATAAMGEEASRQMG